MKNFIYLLSIGMVTLTAFNLFGQEAAEVITEVVVENGDEIIKEAQEPGYLLIGKITAVATILALIIEQVLPFIKGVKANSILQGVLNLLSKFKGKEK